MVWPLVEYPDLKIDKRQWFRSVNHVDNRLCANYKIYNSNNSSSHVVITHVCLATIFVRHYFRIFTSYAILLLITPLPFCAKATRPTSTNVVYLILDCKSSMPPSSARTLSTLLTKNTTLAETNRLFFFFFFSQTFNCST